MILYGLGVIVKPSLITDNLETYSNLELETFGNSYQNLVRYIVRLILLIGCFNIIIGTIGVIAVYESFRVKQKWLLAILFLTNVLGYLAPVLFDIVTGVITYIEVMEMVSFILTIIALIIIIPE